MKCFEEPGSLIIVQVDHLSGEMLGEIWEQLSSKGAKNVQILSALTKKGRPGQLLLIDIPPENMSELEEFLVSEMGVNGWHRILSEHVHVDIEMVSYDLTFRTPAGRLRVKVAGKRIKNTSGSVRPEHGDCVQVQRKLRQEAGLEVSLWQLERLISKALNSSKRRVEINLCDDQQGGPGNVISLDKEI
jgi:uncharacterized protein (DUF111 family)